MAKHEIIIGPRGDARAVYSPVTDGILRNLAADGKGGEFSTRRASHVEPTLELSDRAITRIMEQQPDKRIGQDPRYATPPESPDVVRKWFSEIPRFRDKWWADMTPLNPDGPVLGPYDDRDTALAEEVKWLKEHNIPVCEPCVRRVFPDRPETMLIEADMANAPELSAGASMIAAEPPVSQHVQYLTAADTASGRCWGYAGEGWYFWDETQANCYGPYPTATAAQTALEAYARQLNAE